MTDEVKKRYEDELGKLVEKKNHIDEILLDTSLSLEDSKYYTKIKEDFDSGIYAMEQKKHNFNSIDDINDYINDAKGSFKKLISMKIHNTPSSAAPPSETEASISPNGEPKVPSQDLGKLEAVLNMEIKKLKNNLANMTTQKESAKQAAQYKQTEIKEALEKMLTSLKNRLDKEKDNVSEEVKKTIKDKIVEVDGFIQNPDLDITVLDDVEKINEEIETAKWKHEFSAKGVKELCERLQELMEQLTRHSHPPLTGGRKTRNKKKKKKSKAKKNKTRRRRRRSKA